MLFVLFFGGFLVRFDRHSFNYVVLCHPLLLLSYNDYLTGELAPPTDYLDEPTSNNCITIMNGNKHSFRFSSNHFSKFSLTVVHLNANLEINSQFSR